MGVEIDLYKFMLNGSDYRCTDARVELATFLEMLSTTLLLSDSEKQVMGRHCLFNAKEKFC